jgi:hypothetical protein
MSYTVKIAVEKLKLLLDSYVIMEASVGEEIQNVIDLLEDPKMLLIEWGEADVQAVARQRIAYLEDVEECEVKENPLTREQVERVLEVLEKQYDSNYGITWEHLTMAMDYIDLPNIIEAGRKPMTRKQYEEYLNELGIPHDDVKSEGGRIPDTAKYGSWLRRNDPVAFNVGYEDEKRNRR